MLHPYLTKCFASFVVAAIHLSSFHNLTCRICIAKRNGLNHVRLQWEILVSVFCLKHPYRDELVYLTRPHAIERKVNPLSESVDLNKQSCRVHNKKKNEKKRPSHVFLKIIRFFLAHLLQSVKTVTNSIRYLNQLQGYYSF